jgi:phosphocarrier protein FPr
MASIDTSAFGQLRILSPLSGQTWPLERVPDPVFAQKMVGDGISIDPTDALLVAGCDGDVVAIFRRVYLAS